MTGTDMMKGKVAVVLVALALAGGASGEVSNANGDESQRSEMAQLRQRIHDALNLSGEQRLQLKDLRLGLQAELEAIHERVAHGDLTSSQGREAYRSATQAHRMGQEAVMTEEQRALLVRARRSVRELELDGEGGGENGRDRHFARLVDELELTDYQKERWHELLREQRERFQEIKEEADGEYDPGIVRRMRDEHKARFRMLLDEGQLIRLEEIRADWERRRLEQIGADGSDSEFGIDDDEFDDETAIGEESWGVSSFEVDETD